MMTEDGIHLLLPKSDDAWNKFLNPFLRLTRKEDSDAKNGAKIYSVWPDGIWETAPIEIFKFLLKVEHF